MKTKKRIILIALSLLTFFTNAQSNQKEIKTITFAVRGNCEQCKKRIENAADIKGVKLAEWDVKAQTIKVTYRADKVSEQQIKEAIAKAGHDVEGVKALDENYSNLPSCCKYRDKKCEEKK